MEYRHFKVFVFLFLSIFAFVHPPAWSQTVVEIFEQQRVQDATIQNDAPTLNTGASTDHRTGQNGTGIIRRTLIRFDLSAIPQNTTILNVELQLTLTNVPNNAAPTVQAMHRVLSSWVEGEGIDIIGELREGAVSWNSREEGALAWNSPGGDYEETASLEAEVGTERGAVAVFTGNGLAQDVQRWLDGDVENYGWIILGDESVIRTVRGYASSEAESGQPRLVVTYQLPDTDVDLWQLY